MITASFEPSAGFEADDGTAQRLRVAFVDAGLPAGKPSTVLFIAASLGHESGEIIRDQHFHRSLWMSRVAKW